jgi:hypothetical protein
MEMLMSKTQDLRMTPEGKKVHDGVVVKISAVDRSTRSVF